MSVPLKILIVEDSEDDTLLIIDELRRNGYDPQPERVQTRQATEAALAKDWDCIIADYRLPSFSGLDALSMVRERDPDIPFIIVSGHISEDTAVEAMRSGAQDYVLKDHLARLGPAIDRELREVCVRRDRRHADEARQRTEQILQSVIDSSNAAVYLKDLEGRFLVVNSRSAQILGVTRQDAVGRTDHDFLPREVAERHAAHDRQVIETGAAQEFEEPVQDDHGWHTFISAKFPVYDSSGAVSGIGGISTDVTELIKLRREVEEALERERHFSLLLQRALLPSVPDMGVGYDVAAVYVAAYAGREIGGDFYDVFKVGEDRAGILIGDVSGKGLEAAALAAATRSTVHAFVHETACPAEALTRANAVMYPQQIEFGAFVTVFLVIVDIRTGDLGYAGAGHPPAVLCRRDGTIDYLRHGQTPLGVMEGQQYEAYHDFFAPGDRLVLYTDGVSEARYDQALFDTEGIERVLNECGDLCPHDLAKSVIDAAERWTRGKLRDDAAVVVARRLRVGD